MEFWWPRHTAEEVVFKKKNSSRRAVAHASCVSPWMLEDPVMFSRAIPDDAVHIIGGKQTNFLLMKSRQGYPKTSTSPRNP